MSIHLRIVHHMSLPDLSNLTYDSGSKTWAIDKNCKNSSEFLTNRIFLETRFLSSIKDNLWQAAIEAWSQCDIRRKCLWEHRLFDCSSEDARASMDFDSLGAILDAGTIRALFQQSSSNCRDNGGQIFILDIFDL